MVSGEGEPTFCDIEVQLTDSPPEGIASFIATSLEQLGAPRGSTAIGQDGSVLATFGATAGVALYLNGTELPAEVYARSDINELIETIGRTLSGAGRMFSYWEGPRDTALYLYGPDEEVMRTRLAPLLSSRPDTQLSRLETIA